MFKSSKKWRTGCLGLLGLFLACGVLSRFAPSRTPASLPTTASRQLPAVQLSTATPAPTAAQLVVLAATDTATSEPAVVNAVAIATDTPSANQTLTLVALDNANLRSGPGTTFDITGSAVAGQALNIIGHNDDSTWYQLADQSWIAAALAGSADAITSAPTETAQRLVAAETPASLPTDTPAVSTVSNDPAVSAEPPAGSDCVIKGNVNSKGDKIYHTPSSRSYTLTKINPDEGDRWFCTEGEAQAAGFRAPEQ